MDYIRCNSNFKGSGTVLSFEKRDRIILFFGFGGFENKKKELDELDSSYHKFICFTYNGINRSTRDTKRLFFSWQGLVYRWRNFPSTKRMWFALWRYVVLLEAFTYCSYLSTSHSTTGIPRGKRKLRDAVCTASRVQFE